MYLKKIVYACITHIFIDSLVTCLCTTVEENKIQTCIHPPMLLLLGCFLGHNCLVAGPCRPCQKGQKLQCLNTHMSFAVCSEDAYVIRRCIGRSRVNDRSLSCTGDVYRKAFLYRWRFLHNETYLHLNR